MKPSAVNSPNKHTRIYDPEASIVFCKTKERFGGLSNMAAGFPLIVNGIHIRTSEALYQACRFPYRGDVQKLVIAERSPMTAKMRGKKFLNDTRSDWNSLRTTIMRWCLRVKLAQNWKSFGALLRKTSDLPIVELSSKDDFWGAKMTEEGSLVGANVLGRLLMALREEFFEEHQDDIQTVEPPEINDFLLYGKPIEAIMVPSDKSSIIRHKQWPREQVPVPATGETAPLF